MQIPGQIEGFSAPEALYEDHEGTVDSGLRIMSAHWMDQGYLLENCSIPGEKKEPEHTFSSF